MNLGLRIRLSLMMAFQYAVWSIWVLMIHQRVKEVGLDAQLGWILMTSGLGSILGPIIMGQLADRYFATEKVLAFAHIVGGLVLIATAYATSFWPFFLLMLLYCHLYFPTVGLTNSLTFRAIGEGNQNQFPMIRFFGTIGWIVGTLGLAFYLNSGKSPALQPLFAIVGEPSNQDILRFPGVISIIYGLFCFALPHTPPVPASTTDPFEKKSAIVESLGLMKIRPFAVLVAVASCYGALLYYYFQNENLFLDSLQLDKRYLGAFQTMGNIFEFVSMIVIPVLVTHLGIKRTMLIGAGAYVLMFGLKMIGEPWSLMLASNLLHGVCFGLFFVVSQMFVDKAATADIKASAQSLLVFIVYGVANLVGNYLGGFVRTKFTVLGPDGKAIVSQNWTAIWGVAFALALVSTLAFALLFRETEIRKVDQPAEGSLV